MRIITASEYANMADTKIDWVIEDVLPKGALALLLGEPKAGKSFFALQMAYAVARGESWLGRPVTGAGPVLYLNLDAPEFSWRQRLQGLREHGVNIEGPVYNIHPEDDIRPANILNLAVRTRLGEAIAKVKPVMVVIDVLRELHAQQEESSTEMKVVLDHLQSITQGVSVVLVHHIKKLSNVEDVRVIDLARGSSYLTGKVETIWCLLQNHLHIHARFSERYCLEGKRGAMGTWIFPPLPIVKN